LLRRRGRSNLGVLLAKDKEKDEKERKVKLGTVSSKAQGGG
jgi:hypothetical protein